MNFRTCLLLTPTAIALALPAFAGAQDNASNELSPDDVPAVMLLPESALPEYEKNIDHRKLIRGWNKQTLRQGQEIYQQVCHNCHGDINLPGSIPNSMRFAEGEFQHGSDPYTMYQTMTRGWRLMVPQVQLVPREKYAVIHYIREHFLAGHNREQLFKVTDDYLEDLPDGKSLGPDPVKREPWREMDYGPFLIGTYEIADEEKRNNPWPKGQQPDYVSDGANIAYKAIGIRLDKGPGGVSAGNHWVAFEHDTLRVAGVWQGDGFIDWHGINFDGRHVARPRTVGEPLFETGDGPGWANPDTGEFEDARFAGLDGRRFGPLPREWAHYKGLYRYDDKVVISYTVGDAEILESYQQGKIGGLARMLSIGKSTRDLKVRLASAGTKAAVGGSNDVTIASIGGFAVATIPASATPVNLTFSIGAGASVSALIDHSAFTRGGPPLWPDALESAIIRGEQDGAFQWDSFAMPVANPWKSRLRASGVDFTSDGKAAIVCCWDGDVWRVEGIDDETATTASWRRIASGLFQPLGVKLVDDQIFVSCRDQVVRLDDLNGDGETDFYKSFNSDHQVTEHFHEFAMGLQADDEGNLYYAKSARHARPPLVAHHGTLLKVSSDGSTTQILANGFRAANGVCMNPDGTFFVTDQEGHWNPMNRINWVKPSQPPRFYGNIWSYGAPEDESDSAMEPPLCWVDKGFDRSPSELLWIDSEKWGALDGKLLNLSYGHGRLEIVPHETVSGQLQGGLARLPIPDFPTGTMRGRFHPGNGHLYLCGMSAWGTAQMHLPGGFYRIRTTGKPTYLPTQLNATTEGVDIVFSDPLSQESTEAIADRVRVRSWALKRSANYGSKHFDEKNYDVTGAQLSADGRRLSLRVKGMSPVWQMSIRYQLIGADGTEFEGEIQNTIHQLEANK